MRFEHAAHPGRTVRLGYGLNLYPSRDAAGVLAGLREVARPLAQRVGRAPSLSGVGLWMPAPAVREFLADERRFVELSELIAASALDGFTCNAFPQGDFHGPGLKERVFEPDWGAPARLDYTLSVARLAARLRRGAGGSPAGAHLSLSTHAGAFAARLAPAGRAALVAGLRAAARGLARLEQELGERVVLALEPEPRSNANDTRELERWLTELSAGTDACTQAALARHLGACLDTCHAAVEFERPAEAFARVTAEGRVLGKLQFSSALALAQPGADEHGRARLFALDEPVYLHQVTARRGAALAQLTDLDQLARAWAEGDERFTHADEWRCHFHVPVDLARLADERGNLRTTQDEAARTLAAALGAPERWGSSELHVEVETYTWELFTTVQTAAPSRVEGLAREWTHVQELLRSAGWAPVAR